MVTSYLFDWFLFINENNIGACTQTILLVELNWEKQYFCLNMKQIIQSIKFQ